MFRTLFFNSGFKLGAHGPGILGIFLAVAEHLDLAYIDHLAFNEILPDHLGQAARVGISVGNIDSHCIMRTDEMLLIVAVGQEARLRQHGLGDEVA